MKRLYLLRHAQALSTDYHTKLTVYGIKEAERVGEYLTENNIMPELVLCSPAKRTVSTCDIIFENLEKKPGISILDELYTATEGKLVEIIREVPPKIDSLMVIGHNPGITAVLTKLKPLECSELHVKALDATVTCKLVSIKLDDSRWSDIENAHCVIEGVYWPNSQDVLDRIAG